MNHKGFTLIELVMVIVLLGIIAIFAAPRIENINTTKANAFMNKLKTDLRYGQNLAMSQNRRVRFYLNGTQTAPIQGYALAHDDSAAGNCSSFTAVIDPATWVNLSVDLTMSEYGGITITPSVTCLEYDSLGRPNDCGVGPAVCSITPGGMTITVNANGTSVGTVMVVAQTGAVN